VCAGAPDLLAGEAGNDRRFLQRLSRDNSPYLNNSPAMA
jgi:hypothetical protein